MEAYEYSYMFEELLDSGIISSLVSSGVSSVLNIATYVLTSLAIYTIANRRGLNKPWLAWIPVVNCWLIGSLSDQYRYVVRGENKSKRKALLTLNIINTALAVVMVIVAVAMLVSVVSKAVYGVGEDELMMQVMGPLMGILGLCLPVIGVSIAYSIIYYMALYDIYKSLDPSNCVLFLVLSILFGVTTPFFLFFNRNKDLGMPPRRPEPVYISPQQWEQQTQWQQPEQPAQEPWEQENKDYL